MVKRGHSEENQDFSETEKSSKKISQREMQEMLIDNFVGLQRAMTNMSIKFEGLSEQMRKLLEIFELSAKNFVTQNSSGDSDKDVLDKINSLLEQNKTIAKGLVLLEEKLRGREPPVSENTDYQKSVMTDFKPKQLPSQRI